MLTSRPTCCCSFQCFLVLLLVFYFFIKWRRAGPADYQEHVPILIPLLKTSLDENSVDGVSPPRPYATMLELYAAPPRWELGQIHCSNFLGFVQQALDVYHEKHTVAEQPTLRADVLQMPSQQLQFRVEGLGFRLPFVGPLEPSADIYFGWRKLCTTSCTLYPMHSISSGLSTGARYPPATVWPVALKSGPSTLIPIALIPDSTLPWTQTTSSCWIPLGKYILRSYRG